jgi:glycosyltransferase involved in cell wall biosynthesis
VSLDELKEFIGAADLYITPYLNEAQITSGTLSYAFGAGKAVVSTPFWHAHELLADDRGVLVPFGDPAAIAREVIGLLKDETRRHAIRKNAYKLGRENGLEQRRSLVHGIVCARALGALGAATVLRGQDAG